MVKSNFKEEDLHRRYENSPAFMTKATNGIKKKIGGRNAWCEVENTLGYEEGICEIIK